MTLRADSQLLQPGSMIEVYELDGTSIDPLAGVLLFHAHKQEGIITWQGLEYHPWPVEATGFLITSDKPPTPSLTVANGDGSITALCILYADLIGAKFTRRRTTSRYLDDVNFPGDVNPSGAANPGEHFPDQVWYIERKAAENKSAVKFELSSAMEFNGVRLPRRKILANQCGWRYRSAECGYTGGPVADNLDTPTDDESLDECGLRPGSCKLRFGADNELPYGGFPAAGLIRV